MAGSNPRSKKAQPPADEPGQRELRRLNEAFEAQWRDWIRAGSATADSECLLLTEMVYALSDLHMRAKEMRLDFLVYLIGMALQEAQNELRARESQPYPTPPPAQ